MSFFGLPSDPWAQKPSAAGDGDDEPLNFEETYYGLELDSKNDDFNDDTFGASEEPATRESVGRNFDFAGQTAAVRGSQEQGQRQPQNYAQASRGPARTGYEAYKEPGAIPKLEADASIWGPGVGRRPDVRQESSAAASRKMMSLEEVEAMMRGAPSQPQGMPPQDSDRQAKGLRDMLGVGASQQQQEQPRPMQILQRPQQQVRTGHMAPPGPPQQLHRQPSPQPPRPQSQDFHRQSPMPFPQQQQQHRPQTHGAPPVQPPRGQQPHQRGPSYNGPPITEAHQMMQMSTQDRETYLEEEAKRAKRNHKIHLLSMNNGLMTPQDKNFITRIQLQQLLTATGGVDNEMGSDQQMAEDFYYQVYAQIRGVGVGQGVGSQQFAQTYLLQTAGAGGRYGVGRRGQNARGGDNHVQRMEQQVARAVEAAKARPKNKSLVMEGSLGKIAFSNSKTPRPLLNIKRQDSEARLRHTAKAESVSFDRKAALRDIEKMYTVLMQLEDHERKIPPPPNEESPPEMIEGHMRWRSDMQALNRDLWESLKVMAPIQENPTKPHPFIQLLSHAKGKKAIPRIFRHLDDQQRLTMLTLIVIHLDYLDVIRDAYPPADNKPLPQKVKEEVELFGAAVMPPLFSYVNEAPLGIVVGLLGLVLERSFIPSLVRTRVGVGMLTMLVSRAELVKQQPSPQAEEDRQQYAQLYNRLFDTLEPVLPYLFPTDTNISASDDVHIWQFLAAMGVGASPEDQQQRLVLGVKERVMETVAVSQGLPEQMKERRLGEVNLFMRAIGLDVELLG